MIIFFSILMTLIMVIFFAVLIYAGLSEIWEYKKLKQRNKQR